MASLATFEVVSVSVLMTTPVVSSEQLHTTTSIVDPVYF
jgi:hypothetical protein